MDKEFNVLLIEDNTIDTLLFKHSITPLSDEWVMHLAGTRYLALEKMARMEAANNLPDLIVLNYLLADGSGKKLLQDIRYSKKWRNVPIVLFSTYICEEDLLEASKFGILDFISKPLRMADFKTRVEDIFMAWAHSLDSRMIA
jgi:response regulator RpfG family c-di-GMP phosphodiesterase